MSMQPGGMLPGLEPQGPDTKRLLIVVTMVTVMMMALQFLMPAPTPKPPDATPATATDPTTTPSTTTDPTAAPGDVPALNAAPSTSDALAEERRTFAADVAKTMATTEGAPAVKGGYQAELT